MTKEPLEFRCWACRAPCHRTRLWCEECAAAIREAPIHIRKGTAEVAQGWLLRRSAEQRGEGR